LAQIVPNNVNAHPTFAIHPLVLVFASIVRRVNLAQNAALNAIAKMVPPVIH
jgi:hypothetical protein